MPNFNRRRPSESDVPEGEAPSVQEPSARFSMSETLNESPQETSGGRGYRSYTSPHRLASSILHRLSFRVVGIGVLIVVALLVLSRMDIVPFGGLGGETYQAVFLSNGQVYFGTLSGRESQYPTLTNTYYLQAGQQLQPSTPTPNFSLVKLGGELHGPTDTMRINRDHIVFIEDLKSDSQVVALIEEAQGQ